jgi:hypothetical protein
LASWRFNKTGRREDLPPPRLLRIHPARPASLHRVGRSPARMCAGTFPPTTPSPSVPPLLRQEGSVPAHPPAGGELCFSKPANPVNPVYFCSCSYRRSSAFIGGSKIRIQDQGFSVLSSVCFRVIPWLIGFYRCPSAFIGGSKAVSRDSTSCSYPRLSAFICGSILVFLGVLGGSILVLIFLCVLRVLCGSAFLPQFREGADRCIHVRRRDVAVGDEAQHVDVGRRDQHALRLQVRRPLRRAAAALPHVHAH